MPLGAPSYERDSARLPAPNIFGSRLRTAIMILVAVLEETYPAELARYLLTSISSIQRALDKLESDALIASRPLVVRAVTLNPLYPPVKELRAYLLRLSEGYPQYATLKESRRTRPRSRKKPL